MRMGAGIFTANEWEILQTHLIGATNEDDLDGILDALNDACEAIHARRQVRKTLAEMQAECQALLNQP